MQTFVPYDDFEKSAKVLDTKRLGKQRVEVLQILNALNGLSKGWVNHPAVRMWRNYEYALCSYGLMICRVWKAIGYNDTCWGKINDIQGSLDYDAGHNSDGSIVMPDWWGGDIHKTHRSKLLSKYPDHYRQYWPDEQDNLDYYWPV